MINYEFFYMISCKLFVLGEQPGVDQLAMRAWISSVLQTPIHQQS